MYTSLILILRHTEVKFLFTPVCVMVLGSVGTEFFFKAKKSIPLLSCYFDFYAGSPLNCRP
jgi:hypothetical protein